MHTLSQTNFTRNITIEIALSLYPSYSSLIVPLSIGRLELDLSYMNFCPLGVGEIVKYKFTNLSFYMWFVIIKIKVRITV